MKQGFVKVAAASCAVAVADVRENTRVILETIHKMEDEGAKVMVLPELALTGYTCSDLFWQSQMIDAAKEGLKEIADGTKGTDALILSAFRGNRAESCLTWPLYSVMESCSALYRKSICRTTMNFMSCVTLRREKKR